MTDLPSLARWKKYLRADPTHWLLETDDPSILLWYQLDIAHRPEDSRAVVGTRERVLYSEPAQTIFAAQDDLGYWGDPETPAQPRYNATLWNLALLAELGIPRASRRARRACEFMLQNFLNDDGSFARLNEIETGYLLRAFGYFNFAQDARVLRAARALQDNVNSFQARRSALWGWQAFCADEQIARAAQETIERVLTDENLSSPQWNRAPATVEGADLYAFPPFDPRDELFLLRVLAEYERVDDERVKPPVETLTAKQNESARWNLERDWNEQLLVPFETKNAPSRWITLSALRVVATLVRLLNRSDADS